MKSARTLKRSSSVVSFVLCALCGVLGGLVSATLGSAPCRAEGLDPLSASTLAIIATEEPRKGEEMTPQQEKFLALRQTILEHALEEGEASWKPYEKILGSSRCRELDRALFRFNLYSPAYGHDLWQNPYAMDEMADTVLSAYAKLQREHLEQVLGIDEWLDSKRPISNRDRQSGSSFRLRISPRFSSNYLGVKFRMPYSDVGVLDHLSLRVRYDFEEARPVYMLKFDDQIRFLDLTYEPDTEKFGDLLSLSFRFVW